MMYLFLILGFIFLIKGADLFVDGSKNIASIFKIPPVIVGLTIVSLGTSLPEASVSITAALNGNNALALSNVTGSNIFNLMVVAAICALIKPMVSNRSILKRDFPVAIAASLAVLLFVFDGTIARFEAFILLFGCAAYIYTLVRSVSKNRKNGIQIESENTENNMTISKSIIYIVFGVGAIILGGDLVVKNAVKIAELYGLSETIIGLTIVSIGTSLPELVTSVVAAKKGESELAFGNALGSCIFNILFILGLSAFISPISVGSDSIIHVNITVLTVLMMFVFSITGNVANRKEGAISALMYVGYMAYLITG